MKLPNPSEHAQRLAERNEEALEIVRALANFRFHEFTPSGARCEYCGMYSGGSLNGGGWAWSEIKHTASCLWLRARRLVRGE